MHYAHITLSSIASLVLDRLLFQLRSAFFFECATNCVLQPCHSALMVLWTGCPLLASQHAVCQELDILS